MADAAKVFGEAGIVAEVFEHRHAGADNPGVVRFNAKRQRLERAVQLAERGIHDAQLQVLDVLGVCASFEFGERSAGLIDLPRASQSPTVIAQIKRSPAAQFDSALEETNRSVVRALSRFRIP